MHQPQVFNATFCQAGPEREQLSSAGVVDSCGLNALTLSDVQSDNDRMSVKEVVVNLETLIGKRFELDACCDDLGVNLIVLTLFPCQILLVP